VAYFRGIPFFLLLALLLDAGMATAAEITALRSWRAPDNTRLVLDLTGAVHYQISPDSTPARVVVEIEDAQSTGPLVLPPVQPPLKAVRLEKSGKGERLIIETTQELLPKIFQLPPNEKYGYRLVLDLFDKALPPGAAKPADSAPEKSAADAADEKKALEAMGVAQPAAVAAAVEKELASVTAPVALPPTTAVAKPAEKAADKVVEKAAEGSLPPTAVVPEKLDLKRYRNIVVALDAGHGGEDPGAIGRRGSHEKHITLAIARDLHDLLAKEPGITPVLVRNGDYFIPLQERRRLARYQHKADIFISIHADAAENRSANGASVFALSLKGAGNATSRFARMLAERENRADLIGGVAIENEDDILRGVLADMVVAGSLEHSLHMGRNILRGLDRVGRLHSQHVEQAGFAVLKEPGMVSLLVETGFISNPDEEAKLISRKYQREIAEAVARGVRDYCQNYPAPGTYFAWLSDKDRALSGSSTVNTVRATPAGPPQPVLVSAAVRKPVPAKPKVRRHKVRSGDNLTRLAAHYGVSMRELRETNRLRDDNVKVGQVLIIPVN
jgi:N-acetylmuramoyl-L-alanine amidase